MAGQNSTGHRADHFAHLASGVSSWRDCQDWHATCGLARIARGERFVWLEGAGQRILTALYGLDLGNPIFRALRRLWSLNEQAQPTLALLVALAREVILGGTIEPVHNAVTLAEIAVEKGAKACRAAPARTARYAAPRAKAYALAA